MPRFDVTFTFEYVKDKLDMYSIAESINDSLNKEKGYHCKVKKIEINDDI